MIRLSNGHTFEYMAASGALGYDGKGWPWEQQWRISRLLDPTLFTSATKTLTLLPEKGNLRWWNPFGCVRILRGGVINAVGLTNPGFPWWEREVGPRIDSSKIRLVLSIHGNPNELAEMARRAGAFDLVGIEINDSCPNIRERAMNDAERTIASCKAVAADSSLPTILKVSVCHDISRILPRVEKIIDAISINSVPWKMVFPNSKSPFWHLGGGAISGKIAQPFTWKLVWEICKMSKIPVIGPSVWEFEDLDGVRCAGAQAISFGSIFMPYPWRPTLYVRKEQKLKHLNAKEVSGTSQ